jgi:hypothetical protein
MNRGLFTHSHTTHRLITDVQPISINISNISTAQNGTQINSRTK